MGALGASKLQKTGAPETLGAARLNASAQTSELDTLVSNLSGAIEKCLIDMAGFMGISDDITYELNRDFFEGSLTPELIGAVTGLQLNGKHSQGLVENQTWQSLYRTYQNLLHPCFGSNPTSQATDSAQ